MIEILIDFIWINSISESEFRNISEMQLQQKTQKRNSKSNNAIFGKILSPLYSFISLLLLHPVSPSLLLSQRPSAAEISI